MRYLALFSILCFGLTGCYIPSNERVIEREYIRPYPQPQHYHCPPPPPRPCPPPQPHCPPPQQHHHHSQPFIEFHIGSCSPSHHCGRCDVCRKHGWH